MNKWKKCGRGIGANLRCGYCFDELEEQLAEKDEKLSYYESDHLVSSITIDDKKYILLGDYRNMEKTKDAEIARLNAVIDESRPFISELYDVITRLYSNVPALRYNVRKIKELIGEGRDDV